MWNTLLRIVGLLVLHSCTEPSAPELPIRSQSTETLNELPSVNEPLANANLTLWVAAEKRECWQPALRIVCKSALTAGRMAIVLWRNTRL